MVATVAVAAAVAVVVEKIVHLRIDRPQPIVP